MAISKLSFNRERLLENVPDRCHLPRSGFLSKLTPSSGHLMIRDTAKNPVATSQTLQASVSMLNVKVHEIRSKKKLYKYGLFGRVAGESLFFLKRTWQHSLGL